MAQFGKGINIEPTFHIGQILKHTPKLNFNVDDISYGFEINLTNTKYGVKKWHQQLNYPVAGVDIFYYHLGDKDILGDAIGIFPNIAFPIFQRKRLGLSFQLGAGIAYLTQHYDPIENTTNNAIGSNLNNITSFKWYLAYQANPKLKVSTGLSFTHFSNGSAQLPNFGINVLAYTLGIQYTPNPVQAEDYIHHEETQPFKRKWGMDIHLDMGFRENLVSGGPRYPVYIASLSATYLISPINRWSLGLE